MKTFLLTTVSMVALASVARAADLPPRAPVLTPAPVANWTGGYVGIQGGVFRRNASLEFSPVPDLVDPGTPGHAASDTGAVIGGLAGYNWRQGRLVYGLEGDWSRVGVKAARSRSIFTATSYDIDWLATMRGRAGVAVDSALFYVTGGAAFGRVKNTFDFVFSDDNSIFASYTQKATKLGWTLGAGVEHRFAPHWTARAEFRYVDLGKSSVACVPGTGFCDPGQRISGLAEFRNSLALGLVGLTYAFADDRTGGWREARAPSPAPAAVWSGTYLGIQGGLARHEALFVDPDGLLVGVLSDFYQGKRTGGALGGFVGHNWQKGSFVYGVEGDWNWIGAKANRSVDQFDDRISTSFDVNWLATLRGRAGLAVDSTLLYAVGGLAAGHIRNSAERQFSGGIGSVSFNQRQTKFGWTAGVGAEHMFSPHWTARAEFRYVDLGTKQVSCTATGSPACTTPSGAPYRGEFSSKLMLGLVGLAYRF
jgi:outer membrane immunogenic protein